MSQNLSSAADEVGTLRVKIGSRQPIRALGIKRFQNSFPSFNKCRSPSES